MISGRSKADIQKHNRDKPLASEGEKTHRSVDLLGRVYEYFLTRFASAEGKNGSQCQHPVLRRRDARPRGMPTSPGCSTSSTTSRSTETSMAAKR